MIGWVELLKQEEPKTVPKLPLELEKDVSRLQVVTERFSKIGSQPELVLELDLCKLPSSDTAVDYSSNCASGKERHLRPIDLPDELMVVLNRPRTLRVGH